MRTWIVYDSYYGNTEQIARAVAAELDAAGKGPVGLSKAESTRPEQLQGLDLLLLGSPTRAFRMSERMKAFVRTIPPGSLRGVKVAALDTRIAVAEVKNALLSFGARVFGYAAEPMAKALVKAGGEQVAPPAGFFVQDAEGPLKDGELERAKEWARQIAAAL